VISLNPLRLARLKSGKCQYEAALQTGIAQSLISLFETFHSLRHSFGSLVQQTQRDIRITQQLMNHKSIQMTERYTHSRSEAKMDAVNSIDWGLHKEKSPMSVNVS
jgi:integrase